MKNNTTPNTQKTSNANLQKSRPENKDDLDSRENEEQLTKGDDVTHNQKAHRNKNNDRKKDKK